MGTQAENLETRVSLTGVEQYKRGQQMLGAGWRTFRGDASAAQGVMGKFGAAADNWIVTAGLLAGTGYAVNRFFTAGVGQAQRSEAVTAQLNTALKANLGMTGAAAESMNELAVSYSAAQGKSMFGGAEIKSAVAMLSTFKMTEEMLRAFTPALIDMAEGYRKSTGGTMDLQSAAIMLGKAVNGNVGALRRFGIFVDEAAFKEKGWVAIQEELKREFGGQSASAMKTAEGAVRAYSASVGALQKEMAEGLLPVISVTARGARVLVSALRSMNSATHGVVGVLGAAGGVAAMVAAGLLVSVRMWRMMREELTGVAGAADRAAAGLKAAGTAAATSGATAAVAGSATPTGAAMAANAVLPMGAAATAGMAGNAAVAGKAAGRFAGAGKFMRGFGPAALAAIVGMGLDSIGHVNASDYKNGPNKAKLAGKAAAGMAGSALSFASTGALLGSVVPGLGTGAGAVLGGAIGLARGAYNSVTEGAAARKAAEDEAKAAQLSAVPKGGQSKTEAYLKAIVGELKDTKRAIIGGGERTAHAMNEGDLQRAVYGTLSRAVI